MTEPDDNGEGDEGASGLYVTNAEIIRRLGFGRKRGYRLIEELSRNRPGRRPYPPKDPMFANRRFWPAVLQWHMDYHRVGAASAPGLAPTEWTENFNDPPRKTRDHGRARPHMAET